MLPPDLLNLAQWVCWKAEKRQSKRKGDYWTKVPYSARTGGKASATDSATWATFTDARDACKRSGYDGLGFVFAGDLVGIDLDDCRDAETGKIAEWARPILAPFAGCYMEASPSGTGVHIIVLGQMPKGGNRTPYGGGVIEMYGVDRFFTMTGDLLDDYGAAASIAQRQDAIDALHAALFPKAAERTGPRPAPRPVALDDQALLDKAMNPDTGAGRDFAALWRGDISAYGNDDSRGDFNLARHLAFWTGGDVPRIERLMRSSSLMRGKYDQRDGRYGTYLLRTIERAISYNAGRYYSGATATFQGCQDDTGENDAPAQETRGSTAQDGQNACCAAKDKIIAQLQRELAKERERVKQLEGELTWERKLRANKKLSPAQRIVGSVLREQWKRAEAKGAADEMPVHLPTLAKQAGMSERTVSTTIQQFHSMGAATRDPRPAIAQSGPNKGRLVTHLFVDPRPLLASPDKLEPEKPRNHGGRRVCPECGSKHLRVKLKAQLTCMECGNRWETESAERILRGDEEEMTAVSDAMLVGGVSGGCQDDTGEMVASTDENCAPVSVQTIGGNVCTPQNGAEGLNHRDERAELLELAESLGWRTRIPVGIENVGKTEMRWRDFTERADNGLIDEALRQLRIRAAAYGTGVAS